MKEVLKYIKKNILGFVVLTVITILLVGFLYSYYMVYLPQKQALIQERYENPEEFANTSGVPSFSIESNYWDWLKNQFSGPGKAAPYNYTR
ncbi:hypothetical protein GM182_02340 [bacterium 3DAC]|nr:hypothetical protein GM182_02340 [bacterium 3DAC]